MTVPFYFHWVDESENTFDPATMAVVDEHIFSFEIKHEEGQIPTLALEMKNPRVGLLAPDRKVWAWLADTDPGNGHPRPLFFGVLVGIPSDLFAEKITLNFIARSPNYIQAKQAVAETMRVRPFYDPIWLDLAHRDEPDSILEGWSALWHVDRTTLAVTASDILTGEDGTVTFQEGDAFYNSVRLQIGEAPLTDIEVRASVNWTQRTIGYIKGPSINIASYTGSTFFSEWPKPGASLGGGWFVESSFVNDVYATELTPMINFSSTFTNKRLDKQDCDVVSASSSGSYPADLAPDSISAVLTARGEGGICDPFGSDPFNIFGDGSTPVNRPMHMAVTGVHIPAWYLNCSWKLRYEPKREYSEEIYMHVTANTQPVITSPLVAQHTELLNVAAVNVGEPLLELDAWSDFAGQAVTVAETIFPNNPTHPGGLSYQVCVQAGTAGVVEPVFSDIPGTITIDGTVHWASLGPTPLTSQPNWTAASNVPTGEVICYEPTTFDQASGKFQATGDAFYLLCVNGGETNGVYTEFTYIPEVVSSDEFTPAPVHIAYIQGPGLWGPQGEFLGLDSVADGSVTWLQITDPNLYSIPIGGSVVNVTARNFFPTDRGLQSVEYLLCRARARLRLRARTVKVQWDCPFDHAAELSCRMGARLFDPRLPGGQATGKITGYTLCAHSDGKLYGHVEVGCSVGFGNAVTGSDGVPEYTNGTGYMQPGYQMYDGASTAVAGDISYERPGYGIFDDGLSFPLGDFRLVSKGIISGSLKGQAVALAPGLKTAAILAVASMPPIEPEAPDDSESTFSYQTGGWALEEMERRYTVTSLPYLMEANPVCYELLLKPVVNGPFSGAYNIIVTPLEVPQGVNLEAPSSP